MLSRSASVLQVDGVAIDNRWQGSTGSAQIDQDGAIGLAEFLGQRQQVIAVETGAAGKEQQGPAGSVNAVMDLKTVVQEGTRGLFGLVGFGFGNQLAREFCLFARDADFKRQVGQNGIAHQHCHDSIGF